jgi:ATP-dependent DNA ligase
VHHPAVAGLDGAQALEACAEVGVAGIVLKRLASPYLPGRRSPDWRKLKVSTWAPDHMPRGASRDEVGAQA